MSTFQICHHQSSSNYGGLTYDLSEANMSAEESRDVTFVKSNLFARG
jgi:hypothetical protein